MDTPTSRPATPTQPMVIDKTGSKPGSRAPSPSTNQFSRSTLEPAKNVHHKDLNRHFGSSLVCVQEEEESDNAEAPLLSEGSSRSSIVELD